MKLAVRSCCWLFSLAATCGAACAGDAPGSSPYFAEVAGAIPDQTPIYDALTGALIVFITPVDISHDGRDDLVLHYMKFANPTGQVSNTPCINRIVVLVQRSDDTFVDKTTTYIKGPADLGACSRKSLVVDVNADGYDDVVFATNQEDGRNTDVWSRIEAPVKALVSRSDGRYAVESFGVPSWGHSVGFGYDASGKVFVAAAGFTRPSQVLQRSSNGSWLDVTSAYPGTNANTFLFHTAAGTFPSDELIQNGTYPKNYDVAGAYRDGSGVWHSVPELNLFPYVGTVQLITWNGAIAPAEPVVQIGADYAVAGSYTASCRFRMAPGSAVMTVQKLSAGFLPVDYTGPDQVVNQDDIIPIARLFAFRLEDKALVQASLPIAREQQQENANFISCGDLNGDGYMDIAVFPYNSDGYPLIYMNTRNDSLRYIGKAAFPPPAADDWDNQGASLMDDFDQDGIPDLLTWPGEGRSSEFGGNMSFHYYKGTSLLPIAWHADRDFDADATSDIAWHNVRTGANTIWHSSDGKLKQAVDGISDLDWRIVGVGDFDGDGHDDLLWRHAKTGKNAYWPAGVHGRTHAMPAVTNSAWKVVGVGDFDGDGEDDMFWRNDQTGANTIWRSADSATKQTTPGVTDLGWQVVAVADFDGDGQDDVFWRHATSGANTIWRSGRRTTSIAVIKVSAVWKVAGAADFDDDGRADVLWHNPATGANTIWRSGSSTTKQAVAAMPDLGWQVADTGDYNGDGKADILWRNGRTGENVIWRSALVTAIQAAKSVPDPAWTVIR